MNFAEFTHSKVVRTSALVVAVGALVTTGRVLWHDFGWITPTAYAADQEKLVQLENTILGVLQANQDEWKCDEYDEELMELLQDQRDGDDSIETEEDVMRIRALRAKRNCSRFDE